MGEKKAAPVKMIWMFVCLGLFSIAIVLPGMMNSVFFNPRNFRNIFSQAVLYMLLCGGAGLCFARGVVNLSLPGTAALSGMIFALLMQGGAGFGAAMCVALLIAMLMGCITGAFTIQRRRSVFLFTAVTSLLVDRLCAGINFTISDGMPVSGMPNALRLGNDPIVMAVMLFLVIGVCALGCIGGRGHFAYGPNAPLSSGGGRFLWTVIAAFLAGLAGILMATRMGTAMPTMFSDHNASVILPVLLAAGIMIPNLRGTVGQTIFGHVSVLLMALASACLSNAFNIMALNSFTQIVLHVVLALLFAIPNMLIGRVGNDKQF